MEMQARRDDARVAQERHEQRREEDRLHREKDWLQREEERREREGREARRERASDLRARQQLMLLTSMLAGGPFERTLKRKLEEDQENNDDHE